jgi:ribosome-associated protein
VKGKILESPANRKGSEPLQNERSGKVAVKSVIDIVLASLDDSKVEELISINIEGKSALADYMVIASGRSNRHVCAIADHVISSLKEAGYGRVQVEGMPSGDWVLVDADDVIVHIFRPEVRTFYNLEKMWQAPDLDNVKH